MRTADLPHVLTMITIGNVDNFYYNACLICSEMPDSQQNMIEITKKKDSRKDSNCHVDVPCCTWRWVLWGWFLERAVNPRGGLVRRIKGERDSVSSLQNSRYSTESLRATEGQETHVHVH